jgi:hypothetical protein
MGTVYDQTKNENDQSNVNAINSNKGNDQSQNQKDHFKKKNTRGRPKNAKRNEQSDEENDQSEEDLQIESSSEGEYDCLNRIFELGFSGSVHRTNIYNTYKLYTSRLLDIILLKTGWKNLYIRSNKLRNEVPMICLGCLTLWAPDYFRKHVIRMHRRNILALPTNMRSTITKKVDKQNKLTTIINKNYNNIILEWNYKKSFLDDISKKSLFSAFSDIFPKCKNEDIIENEHFKNRNEYVKKRNEQVMEQNDHFNVIKENLNERDELEASGLDKKILNSLKKKNINSRKVKLGGVLYPHVYIEDNIYFHFLYSIYHYFENPEDLEETYVNILEREKTKYHGGYSIFIDSCDPETIKDTTSVLSNMITRVKDEEVNYLQQILNKILEYRKDIEDRHKDAVPIEEE